MEPSPEVGDVLDQTLNSTPIICIYVSLAEPKLHKVAR